MLFQKSQSIFIVCWWHGFGMVFRVDFSSIDGEVQLVMTFVLSKKELKL